MQQIIRHLFKADTLDDVPRRRLEELVEEYPSFSVGHYLLSKKLKAEQADDFLSETQRTNLYFSNPLWLYWLLDESVLDKGWPPREPREPDSSDAVRTETEGVPVEMKDELPVDDRDIPAAGDGALIAIGEAADFGPIPVVEESVVEAPEAELVIPPIALDGMDSLPAEEYPAEEGSSEETVTHAPVEEQHFREELTAAPQVEEKAAAPQEVGETGAQQVVQAEEPLVFQSYHTVDYFASQGIKLSVEENQNPSDRLGRQLKSFTEWLKVMKKLPKKEEDVTPDAIAEQKIQAIAAHSIEGREVLTETMAEVLAKQGMWQKAAEVYQKLSLLNPDKSAYFAGLIGQMQARANEHQNTNF
ncbi:MAG: hypothetical protein Q8927_01810 [Bacteroidota bacterium]|nr:hypothetical protein [Bacteroidota bacterium]MDP4214906.1 hypothetical protein [Bacteroidota bacterium]MDP4254366.1 hypothetical protein [Bacteroidota bacterium]MDP4258833.1 hypothetical protein [Bacteroidota bacterium]